MTTNTPAGAVRVVQDGTALVQVEVQNLGHYAKVLIAILAPALGLLASVNVITPTILGQAVVGILAVIPVYFVTKRFALKAICLAAAAVVQGLIPLIGASWDFTAVTWQDWVAVGLTALAAAGVWVAPNTEKTSIKLVPTDQKIADITSLPPLAPIAPAPAAATITGTVVTDPVTPPAAS